MSKKYKKDKDCLLQLQKEPKKCLFLKLFFDLSI